MGKQTTPTFGAFSRVSARNRQTGESDLKTPQTYTAVGATAILGTISKGCSEGYLPDLRSGHQLFQRPSLQRQIPRRLTPPPAHERPDRYPRSRHHCPETGHGRCHRAGRRVGPHNGRTHGRGTRRPWQRLCRRLAKELQCRPDRVQGINHLLEDR